MHFNSQLQEYETTLRCKTLHSNMCLSFHLATSKTQIIENTPESGFPAHSVDGTISLAVKPTHRAPAGVASTFGSIGSHNNYGTTI